MRGNLFSESWFKVADLRVSLLATAAVQKQYYRGKLWYVLQDSFNNNYFRITPEAYNFIALLTPNKTVQEVWEECLEAYRENAPSQQEVIDILSQLHINNLLYFKNPPNNEFILERHREKKQKAAKGKLLSFISFKFPLWNPDKWLTDILPLINFLFSVKGLFLWIIVVLLGLKTIVDNFSRIYDQTQGILSHSNLIFMYLSIAVLKFFHELGHAMMSKRFSGRVPTLGLMFLVFTPLPYMDATSSWFFQERRQRILVGSAGMLVDVFFAAIAAMVWANTGDGVIHSIAFNSIIIGSVSSLFFNGNPLIRFDAYYILSDVLEIPNLYQQSRQQWFYWIEKYLFGIRNDAAPSESFTETLWLAIYGVSSLLYRIFLAIVIVLFVADKIFAIGLILAAILLFTGLFLPVKNFAVYLFSSPKLYRTRKRAVAVSVIIAVFLGLFIGAYPFPYAIRAPGVIKSGEFSNVYAETEGRLQKVYFKIGDSVKKGDVIAVLSNYELDLEIKAATAGLTQTSALKQKAIYDSTADLKPLYEREKVLKERLMFLEEKKKNLTVVAMSSGDFIAPDIESFQGMWLKRQTKIGTLIGKGEFKFYGTVSQKQAFDIFREKRFKAQIKLSGNASEDIELNEIVVIPYKREELPSAALGWLGGGDIPVSTDEKSGKKVTEPFFEISGTIATSNPVTYSLLYHGHSGVLRLTMPPEPLAVQGYRLIKQTIQKRYRI